MAFWKWTFLGNSLQSWLLAAVVAGGALMALWGLQQATRVRFSRRAQQTKADVDDLIARLLARTRLTLVAALCAYAGSLALSLKGGAPTWLRTVALIALLAQVAIWGDELITFWLAHYQKRHLESDAEQVTTIRGVGFLVRLALFALVVVVALDNIPGVEVTSLVAGLGIGGIAVALAVQNILADLLASLSIALDRPFVIGDSIAVGDLSGTVEHIGLKTTRLRSLSGEQLVLANNDLLGSRIRNYKRMAERRVAFSLGVTLDTPHEELVRIPALIREIIAPLPQVRFERVHLKEIGSSALIYEVVYYMLAPDYLLYMDTQQAINLGIVERFRSEAIAFAYPTQTLYLRQGALL